MQCITIMSVAKFHSNRLDMKISKLMKFFLKLKPILDYKEAAFRGMEDTISVVERMEIGAYCLQIGLYKG